MVRSIIGQFGDQVMLLSPVETFELGSELSFHYHMRISNEDTAAALAVFTYSELHVYERRLVEIRGNHGTSWHQESVCLPQGTYQLAFVATHGLQFLSDIALDDIEVHTDEKDPNCIYEFEYEVEHDDGKYYTSEITFMIVMIISIIFLLFHLKLLFLKVYMNSKIV